MSNGNICPICGMNDVSQKVSSIVTSGTISVQIPGYYGTSATTLARQLAPPPEPSKFFCAGACVGISYVAFLYFGTIFVGKIAMTMAGVYLGVLCGTITALLGFSSFLYFGRRIRKHNLAEYAEKKDIWDTALARWNSLYYCCRDDIVYNPETGESCPPSQIETLLHS